MNQNGTVFAVFDVAQDRQHGWQIMAVDWPHIVEAKFFKHGAVIPKGARIFLCLASLVSNETRHATVQLFGRLAHGTICLARHQSRQIMAHRAGRLGDGHVVIVQNDDLTGVHATAVVHCLIGHSGGDGTITNHRHNVALNAIEARGFRHAQSSRNRGRRVRRSKRIILALSSLGEPGKPALLAQRTHEMAAFGQNFMRITLVSYIPYQTIMRRVENGMQRDGQFDNTKAGAKVPTCHRYDINQFRAQFICQPGQLTVVQSS